MGTRGRAPARPRSEDEANRDDQVSRGPADELTPASSPSDPHRDQRAPPAPASRVVVHGLDGRSGPNSRVMTRLRALERSQRNSVHQQLRLTSGTTVGRYRLLSALGERGIPTAFSAFDLKLGRKVALKFAELDTEHSPQFEHGHSAQLLAGTRHPHLVPIFDVGELSGRPYVAMELVRGTTLDAWARQRSRRWPSIIAIIQSCCSALDAAHRAGLIHGRLSARDIMVREDGRACVLGFGLSQGREDGDESGDRQALCEIFMHIVRTEMPRFPPRPPWLLAILRRGYRGDGPWHALAHIEAAIARAYQASSQRRWLAAMLVVSAVTALTIGVASSPASMLCDGAERELSGLWQSADRNEVALRFTNSRLAFAHDAWVRIDAIMGTYRRQWIDNHHSICRESQAQPEQLDRKMACMQRARSAWAELIEELRNADATVMRNSTEAGESLPDASACLDVARLASDQPEPDSRSQRKVVRELRQQLSAANTLVQTGAWHRAHETLQTLVDGAEATLYQPLMAEAYHQLGYLESLLRMQGRGLEYSWRALEYATSSGHHRLAAITGSAAAFTMLTGSARPRVATDKVELSEALLKRSRMDLEKSFRAATNRAILFGAQGLHADSRQTFIDLLELQRERYGPQSAFAVVALNNICFSHILEGQVLRSIQPCRRALAMSHQVNGLMHPSQLLPAGNLASGLILSGQHEQLVVELRHATTVCTSPAGRTSAHCGGIFQNKLIAQRLLHRLDEAEADLRAWKTWARMSKHLTPVISLNMLLEESELAADFGDSERALQLSRQGFALADTEELRGTDDWTNAASSYAGMLLRIGACKRALEFTDEHIGAHFDAKRASLARMNRLMMATTLAEIELDCGRIAAARARVQRSRHLLGGSWLPPLYRAEFLRVASRIGSTGLDDDAMGSSAEQAYELASSTLGTDNPRLWPFILELARSSGALVSTSTLRRLLDHARQWLRAAGGNTFQLAQLERVRREVLAPRSGDPQPELNPNKL